MSTALVPVDEQPSFSARQVELIKSTLCPGINDDQLYLFGEICRRTGLDPLRRQVYAILRNKREKTEDGKGWHTVKVMTIQTGIDGYRATAAKTRQLAGIDDATYDTEDGANPNRATVTVWRLVAGQRCAFTATARWSEYAVYEDVYENNVKTDAKKLNGMWGRMPFHMLAKCAESLALRKAFPDELSGVYTADEMQQADSYDATTEHIRQTVAANRLTRADLDDYAAEHGIAQGLVRAGLEKYAGDIERTLEAMRTYVERSKAADEARAAKPTAPIGPARKATVTPAPATPSADMSLAKFTERAKKELGLTLRQAMDRLGVKSVAGMNLVQAFETLAHPAAPAPAEDDEEVTFEVDGLVEPAEVAEAYSLEHLPVHSA